MEKENGRTGKNFGSSSEVKKPGSKMADFRPWEEKAGGKIPEGKNFSVERGYRQGPPEVLTHQRTKHQKAETTINSPIWRGKKKYKGAHAGRELTKNED